MRDGTPYPDDAPTQPTVPPRTDEQRRLDLLEDEAQRARAAVDATHDRYDVLQGEIRKVLTGVGTMQTTLENGLKEFRSNAWAKRPAWIATLALVVLACVVSYSAWKANG